LEALKKTSDEGSNAAIDSADPLQVGPARKGIESLLVKTWLS